MTSLFRENKLAVAGVVIVAGLIFVAVFATWLAPYDPASQQLMNRLDGPSWQHPFGNDDTRGGISLLGLVARPYLQSRRMSLAEM